MFKRFIYGLLTASLFMTSLSQAHVIGGYKACKVDLHHELHLDGQGVQIIDAEGRKAIIDAKKGLVIEDKPIHLSAHQQQLLQQYRQHLNSAIPKVKEVGQSGVALANEVIDEVSTKFNNTHAFDNVRQSVSDFYNKLEQRYHHNGEWVFKPKALSAMHDNWQKDFADAKRVFNAEFFASAFTLLQQKMSTDEGINFTELQKQLAELKGTVRQKLKSHSAEITKKAQGYCDDMDKLAKEERSLVETIPELQNYQLFNI
ncbi:YggN family protein [Vibrio rarus]|uniref:YggN family protein n=1 Tax=Vibrio rarus TaxID=413403 RepID=UPI0021C29F34|nr:YggN family protein [Vibrio rarus]